MHRPDSRSPQVNALFWSRLACGIPSISTVYAQAWCRCAQVIHMFVHRQQGSSPPTGGQAAADRHGRRSLQAWPARRVQVSGTRWSHRPPWRVGQASGAAGLTSSAGGAKSRVSLRPRRSRHDQAVTQPETLSAADGCRILCLLSVAVGILVPARTEPRYLCDAGNSQS